MADIWDNLNTTKLGDDPGQVINTQTRGIHLERKNRETLSDVKLINDTTFRNDGGPIPGTAVLTTITVTDGTNTNFITPNPGEVWRIQSLGSDVTGRSGSITWQFYSRKTDGSASSKIFYYGASTDQPAFPGDADWRGIGGFLCDENVTLSFTVGGSFTETEMHVHAIRVR